MSVFDRLDLSHDKRIFIRKIFEPNIWLSNIWIIKIYKDSLRNLVTHHSKTNKRENGAPKELRFIYKIS